MMSDNEKTQVKQPKKTNDPLSIFVDFFKLLDQIDQRLKLEDPEYRAKYYPSKN